MNSPTEQGTVGLGVAIGYFSSNGYKISIPLNDTQAYDLIVDDGVLKRVQVKTTRYKRNGKFIVELKTVCAVKSKNTIRYFDSCLVEILFVLTNDGDVYCNPASEVEAKSSFTLNETYSRWKTKSELAGALFAAAKHSRA